MSEPIVDVHQLRKTYRSLSLTGRRRIDAVRGVSLQAYPGEVFGLLGPNGAGKTTLIKMLLGVVKPSGGDATLLGQPIGSSAARSRVGYLPESLRVDRHHSARSALRYYGRMSGMTAAEIRAQSDDLLKLVGLEGRDRESVRRFSKGMYQRLGLAQALLHDPDLLVLDEPTDGLDPVGRNEVRKVIDRLRDSGKTIFLNSHILQEVEMVCTRVAILAKGEIKAIGPIDELAHRDEQKLIVEVPCDGPDDRPPDWQAIFADGEPLELESTQVRDAFRLTIAVAGQDQINGVVDRLRGAGRSIWRLEVRRESLEETFMRLVETDTVDRPSSETDSEVPSAVVGDGGQQ
ncbi:putative ABC transporter ATP-binding protein YxlF [Stieleria maiorica]|uniref:Putative ABC transporter ATP-binding protein YxlF n=1 Tax=Stieleria maiorica TaxID=2795974 RepID=A0A5B9MLH2_9BACT|nr:ABC transporter ATP-binding protein [Stieleria maiorica]QEG00841.1 putative ABC transporter ATP-binding protein YxlF [Stieleria maiorica]